MNHYLSMCRIHSDEMKTQTAVTYLKDNAAVWWRNLVATRQASGNQPLQNWTEFQTAVTKQFKPVNAEKTARDRLANLRQMYSVEAYVHAFRTIVLEIPSMTEEEKLDKFLRDLKNDIRIQVELQSPNTMEEAATLAERVDSIISRRNRGYQGNRSTPQTYKDEGGVVPMEIDAIQRSPLTQNERERLRRTGGCFYCREVGHVAKSCPKKRRDVNNLEYGESEKEQAQ